MKSQIRAHIFRTLASILVLLSSHISAKSEYFRHLTLGDGLSQSSVMAITQDKLGRIWLGTKEGVNVYDGTGITSYKGWISSGPDNERTWIGNVVNSIVSDAAGDIFIMIDHNIVKYDLENEKFSRLTDRGNIRALAGYEGEVVYLAKDSIMLKKSNADKATLAFTVPGVHQVTHLTVDKDNFYISTKNGVHVFDRKTQKHDVLLPGEDIYSSFISKDGTLWITSVDKGLYRFGKGDTSPVAVSAPVAPDGVLGAGQCRNAIEDHSGKIWYGTFSGLYWYDPVTGETRHIKIPMNIGGLTHSSVFGMYCDRIGNLWVGTFYGGVNYFSPEHDKFLNFNYDNFIPESLSHSFVKDMVVDDSGNLWFATDGAGVGCLDRNWNIITQLSAGNGKNTLRQNNIRCIEYDSKGNQLFIGTHMGGLSVYDITRNTIRNLIDDARYKDIPGSIIHQLKIHDGTLFISSRAGLSCLDLSTGTIRKIDTDIRSKMFDIDRNGNLYCISMDNHGLYRISNPTAANAATTLVGIPDNNVFPTDVCATGNGVLVSTLGNGLLLYPYDRTGPVMINASNSRLPNDYCYAISNGAGDAVFVTTEDNVVRINMNGHSMQSQVFSDLFPESHIVNGCALLTLPDGNVLVGSTKGITRLNQLDFSSRAVTENASDIYFSRLRIQNKDITPADGKYIGKALPYTDRIMLPATNNDFSILMGISDYIATDGLSVIEYRMDGIDKDWITVNGNEISYRNLPSGSYRLRARRPGGLEIAIDVIVATPWYISWWAWLIYIALATGVGYFIIHKTLTAARLRGLLKKEKVEREQIEKVNQEKFVFFTNVSHEFQTPLTLIISHIDILLSRYKRHSGLATALTRIRTHSEQMSHLITQLLEFRKLQQNRQVLRIGLHDANETLRENATPFREHAKQRNIDFSIVTSDPAPLGTYDPALINRVLVNLLSNAFKYTPDGGAISCSVRNGNDGQIVFEVRDNGRGIAEKDLPYIFERFYNGTADEIKRHNMDYRSTGIGLAFAKSIVDRHHGTIEVKSREGAGTVFSVFLPCSAEAFANDENTVKDNTREEVTAASDSLSLPDFESDDMPGVRDNMDKDVPLLLIVEDNAELRYNLGEFFSSYFRIAQAENGEEGLSKARELTPDIIISDVLMPVMTGTEMCRIIKSDPDLCHIPVILLTALSTTESKIEGLNTNADDYVTKPFESTLLLARVDNLMRLRTILRKQFEKQPINEVDMSLVNPLDRDLLKRTTDIIEKNIGNLEFDIPLLCREVGVSRSLFFNKFKSLTGMTPNAFILNYRLKYAAALLTAQPHLTLSEVADRSGFTTAVYFSRCFKKQFGVSPAAYRKAPSETAAPES